MKAMIENYINGNLSDAKRQAKRFSQWRIREGLLAIGFSERKASLVADWLKGRDCWQEACDAE